MIRETDVYLVSTPKDCVFIYFPYKECTYCPHMDSGYRCIKLGKTIRLTITGYCEEVVAKGAVREFQKSIFPKCDLTEKEILFIRTFR